MLLIAHKHEVEHNLVQTFSTRAPEAIGNPYIIMGTVEKKAWREGLKHPKPIPEMIEHASDFKEHLGELRHRQGGWYPQHLERPIVEPPPSEEWVKQTGE